MKPNPDALHREQRWALENAARSVSQTFEQLAIEHPDGLRALLAQWQAFAAEPTHPRVREWVGEALAQMPAASLVEQALFLERPDVLAAAAERVDLALLGLGDENEEDLVGDDPERWFGPVDHKGEQGVLASWLPQHSTVDAGTVLRVAELTGPRLRCARLPLRDPTCSWLAATLFFGHVEAAERLWKARERKWTAAEKGEAALAWLSSLEKEEWEPHRNRWSAWWDRLLADPEVLLAPLPVKRGWARTIEPPSRLRAHDLQSHLGTSLRKAQRNDPVDMMGVLLRALNLHGVTSDQVTLRPLDFALQALCRLRTDALLPLKSPGYALLERMKGIDWSAAGTDAFGRLPAFATLDGAMQNGGARVNQSGGLLLLVEQLKTTPPEQKTLWWSLALTAAIRGRSDALSEARSVFRGCHAFEHNAPVLQTLCEHVREQMERPGEQAPAAIAHLTRFWESVAPVLEFTSVPEAAAQWQELRVKALERLRAWDRRRPDATARLEEALLDLAWEPAAPSAVSRPRM